LRFKDTRVEDFQFLDFEKIKRTIISLESIVLKQSKKVV